MKCFKCSKEMGREDGGMTIEGIRITITIDESSRTQATIDYNNTQLGKYSDGNGECNVAICYECYIDGLFNINKEETMPVNENTLGYYYGNPQEQEVTVIYNPYSYTPFQ